MRKLQMILLIIILILTASCSSLNLKIINNSFQGENEEISYLDCYQSGTGIVFHLNIYLFPKEIRIGEYHEKLFLDGQLVDGKELNVTEFLQFPRDIKIEIYNDKNVLVTNAEIEKFMVLDCEGISSLLEISDLYLNAEAIFLINTNELKDITAIKRLKNIKSLYAIGLFDLKDISPIAELTDLRSLHLSFLKNVGNIESLEKLEKLKILDIEWWRDNSDLKFVSTMDELEIIYLSGFKNCDMTSFKTANVKAIYLEDCNGYQLSLLRKLENVRIITLTN